MTTPHAGADRGFMFMPEKGDEVLVAFEHGDAERPYVVGTLWNGVDQAPRTQFWGEDIPPNDVKRIVTKSGHRIQLSDKQGKESIVIATPSKLKIAMLEKADETGRSMILLHSEDGDIFVSAPNGRVHIQSKYFSREVGGSGSTSSPQTTQGKAGAGGGAASGAGGGAASGAGGATGSPAQQNAGSAPGAGSRTNTPAAAAKSSSGSSSAAAAAAAAGKKVLAGASGSASKGPQSDIGKVAASAGKKALLGAALGAAPPDGSVAARQVDTAMAASQNGTPLVEICK